MKKNCAVDANELAHAQVLWEFLRLDHTVSKSEFIITFCGSELCVAEHASDLWLDGVAPFIVFSGGFGNATRHFQKTEAETFAEIAIKRGIPKSAILIEPYSSNTAENILKSRECLRANGYEPSRVIAVQKPYSERRLFATFQKLWPLKHLIVTSPQGSIDCYAQRSDKPLKSLIDSIVGSMQRLFLYSEKGYITPCCIPEPVQNAYNALRAVGYNELSDHSY